MPFLLMPRQRPVEHHIVYLADIVCSLDDNWFIWRPSGSINSLNHTGVVNYALDDAMPVPLEAGANLAGCSTLNPHGEERVSASRTSQVGFTRLVLLKLPISGKPEIG